MSDGLVIDPSGEPQAIFDDANNRSMRAWRTIFALLIFAKVGKQETSEALLEEALSTVETHLRLDQDATPSLSPKLAKAFVADMTRNMVRNALAAVDTAAIVFAHTIIDTAVNDLLRVTAMATPGYWKDRVADDEFAVTVRKLGEATFAAILRERIDLHLKKLANKSMPNRVRALNDCCRTLGHGIPALPGYEYDIGRIEEFDASRHAIVHGKGLVSGLPDTPGAVSYMWRTNFLLITLVQYACSLEFDQSHWLNRSAR